MLRLRLRLRHRLSLNLSLCPSLGFNLCGSSRSCLSFSLVAGGRWRVLGPARPLCAVVSGNCGRGSLGLGRHVNYGTKMAKLCRQNTKCLPVLGGKGRGGGERSLPEWRRVRRKGTLHGALAAGCCRRRMKDRKKESKAKQSKAT